MAESPNDRLNRLQEADLGTARREYISTVDRSFNDTRVQAIEASRKSNVPGSKEQRVAQANKSRLEGWANVHKKIGDTGDLENLDHLLNGQSHRLRLDSMMRGSNAQNHGHKGKKNKDNFTGATQKIPRFHSTSTWSVSAAGRGQRVPQSNQPNRGASRSTQLRPNPPGTRRALDPALDRNNAANNTSPWNGSKAQRLGGRSASIAHNAPTLRTRRPLNFSQIISTPEAFLAAALGMVTTDQTANKLLTENPKTEGSAGTVDHSTGKLSAGPRTPSKPTRQTSPNVGKPSDENVTTRHAASPTPVDKVGSPDHGPSSGSMSLDSHEETPRVASIDIIVQAKKEETLNRKPQDSATNDKVSTPTLCPQKTAGILLDLSCATPQKSGPEAEMSPALEELKGLEFTRFLEPQKPHSSGLASANRRLDFGDALHKDQKSSELDDIEATTDDADEELTIEYKREIDIICQLLERTSLSDTFLSKLNECKEELESRLQLHRSPKLDPEQSQQILTPLVPKPKEPEAVTSAAVEGAPKNGHKHRISTLTSQSHLNAAAPQFTPKSSIKYRSLSSATTDSSMSFQPTPVNVISEFQSESALSDSTAVPGTIVIPSPGSHAGSISAIFATAVERTPSATHLFGDHLLPGRRVIQSSVAVPTVLPTESVLSHAAAPTWSPTTFSIAPRPLKIVNPNASVTSKAKSPNGSSLTPSAPHSESADDIVSDRFMAAKPALNTAQKTTISMMESIYAPKPKVDPSATVQKKPPVSQELSASRYSDPKWI